MPAIPSTPEPVARDTDVQTAHDRVEFPGQYGNWRDYAFSDLPEDEAL